MIPPRTPLPHPDTTLAAKRRAEQRIIRASAAKSASGDERTRTYISSKSGVPDKRQIHLCARQSFARMHFFYTFRDTETLALIYHSSRAFSLFLFTKYILIFIIGFLMNLSDHTSGVLKTRARRNLVEKYEIFIRGKSDKEF